MADLFGKSLYSPKFSIFGHRTLRGPGAFSRASLASTWKVHKDCLYYIFLYFLSFLLNPGNHDVSCSIYEYILNVIRCTVPLNNENMHVVKIHLHLFVISIKTCCQNTWIPPFFKPKPFQSQASGWSQWSEWRGNKKTCQHLIFHIWHIRRHLFSLLSSTIKLKPVHLILICREKILNFYLTKHQKWSRSTPSQSRTIYQRLTI